MKEKLIRIGQLGIALLIGALAMTVYLQHRELEQVSRIDWSPMGASHHPIPTPTPVDPWRPGTIDPHPFNPLR